MRKVDFRGNDQNHFAVNGSSVKPQIDLPWNKGGKLTETIGNKRLGRAVRIALQARFPQCFMPPGVAKKPLKVGIFADLVAACPDIHRFKIQAAIRDYCHGPSYLAALACCVPRIDLSGRVVAEVDAPHVADAAARLNAFPQPVRERMLRRSIASLIESNEVAA